MLKSLALLFLLASHANASLPAEAATWDAEIYYVNFTPEQQAKVETAITLMKKVISSTAFREGVLEYPAFVDTGGYTNGEIYKKILEGSERMGNPAKNNTLNVELELYHEATKTIGHTYPNTTRIWMNTKYFNHYTPVNVAGNLMHEWMHKLGFGHAQNWSTARDHSVPYAVGRLMERLARASL